MLSLAPIYLSLAHLVNAYLEIADLVYCDNACKTFTTNNNKGMTLNISIDTNDQRLLNNMPRRRLKIGQAGNKSKTIIIPGQTLGPVDG